MLRARVWTGIVEAVIARITPDTARSRRTVNAGPGTALYTIRLTLPRAAAFVVGVTGDIELPAGASCEGLTGVQHVVVVAEDGIAISVVRIGCIAGITGVTARLIGVGRIGVV